MDKLNQGFTLFETILVIVILGVIAAMVSGIFHEGFKSYTTTQEITHINQQARIGLLEMERDLRAIRSPNELTISSNNILFTDINGNTINYFLAGTSLMRNSQAVADNISQLTFQYFDANASATSTATLVRYITPVVISTSNNKQTSLRTTIKPRNLF